MASPSDGLFPDLAAISNNFEPELFEKDLYRFWESSGCFDASDVSEPGQKAFCMVIPPPNVTGALHMGHALTFTIEDILTRWRRMCGDNALWLPGTDHAGIATQAQVEKAIAKEGKNSAGHPLTRHDMGREAFLKRVWRWKEEHESTIQNQLRRLGSSVDWKRERFTMDEGCSHAVKEVFVRLHEEGLIYRGERVINWCPRCQTALSDLEVIPTPTNGYLWHIRYDLEGETSAKKDARQSVVIATTRPETLLGDTAVAVHPDDERYRSFHGKKVRLPLLNRMIPIITDPHVDQTFGSGALKVTPAHDFNDYEIGLRHHLPMVSVMGKDGKITSAGGPYAGLPFAEARERVIQDLKGQGFLVKTEDYAHSIGHCQRCNRVAEPMLSKQWFVKIEPLAKPAIEAVEKGEIQFVPKSWEKTYFEWMNHIRDWCISRQLWWGHQIPAWYCGPCQNVMVAREAPSACTQCKAPKNQLQQDPDVLDTWFSSALWPFATLGWPHQTPALKTFYPNTIMETGFDIIFFWVARMIMMGIHFMKKPPFPRVYLHAMVRDEKGEKMSKSKGNVIDPLILMEEDGADSLRFTFAIMASQGRDIKLSKDRVKGYRAFCNKLWNAVRFYQLQWTEISQKHKSALPDLKDLETWVKKNHSKLNPLNRYVLSRLQSVNEQVAQGLEQFELNVSSQALYDFTWHEFCDWYIELSKLSFRKDPESAVPTLLTMTYVLDQLLRMLHPFIPFVTERLWQTLPYKTVVSKKVDSQQKKIQSLMLQAFPKPIATFKDASAERLIQGAQAVVEAIRHFRGENGVSPRKEFPVHYQSRSSEALEFMESFGEEIQLLARVGELKKSASEVKKSDTQNTLIPVSHPAVELVISLKGLVDVEEERKRLSKEISQMEDDLQKAEKKLANPQFADRAPREVVEKEKQRSLELKSQLEKLKTSLQRLA